MFDDILEDVNRLMYNSVKQYDEARTLFDQVEDLLMRHLGNYVPKAIEPFNNIIPFSSLKSNRLDPHMHDPYTNYLYHAISTLGEYTKLSEVAFVWGAARFKRHYLSADNPNGVGLYSSPSDIVRANLSASKYISRGLNLKELEKCTISGETILIPCSGAYGGVLGHGMLTGSIMDGKSVTQHVIRIARKEATDPGFFYYLAAFLCSDNFEYHLITSTRFGKDIPEIAPAGLEDILIPRLDSSIEKEIGAMFHKATNLQEQANMSENTAIKLIEENYEKMIID